MDVDEIRRKNINYWADRLGRSVLAEKCGYKDTIYINQLCGNHGSFGKRTARKIEAALGLEPGWFDRVHEETADKDKLSQIAEKVNDFSDSEMAEVLAQIELIRRRKRGEL